MTTLYPLALIPQVTISEGRAQLPLSPGSDAEYAGPTEAINAWAEQGASWVHVVDLDAQAGNTGNYSAIAKAHRVHVQLSAGVTDEKSFEAARHAKPSRIIVDPTDLTWTQNALGHHADLIAVALDIRQPAVFDLRPTLDDAGCKRYVVRDIAGHHHRWRHDDRHLLKEFCDATSSAVVADGNIAHLDDLHELHELVPDGLDGIILGDPLYDGRFTYAEAEAAGADRFDMFFWGPPDPSSNW